MPEGHTVHRLARQHRKALAGQTIITTSPQGRFSTGAKRLNGQELKRVDAHGKHLFYRWAGGEILHIHLGLFGKFRLHNTKPAPAPTPNTRLTMTGDEATVYLAGPTVCELVDPPEEESIRRRLGPDPLRPGSGALKQTQFIANLARRRIPIGATLLDQRVIAGLGNIYRAETLFRTGIDPRLPANQLSDTAAARLWSEGTTLLRQGRRDGRIITVDPSDVGARRRSDLDRTQRLYVYKRAGEPCRRCGTSVSVAEMAGRGIWWCTSCQPSGAGSQAF
jgi:formamidopyrimidine-DNA glycosylase